MFQVRPEGEEIKQGLNVYPWKERKYSIGFILRIKDWMWQVRYAPAVSKFYWRTMCRT